MPAETKDKAAGFPTWDKMVADAHSTVAEIKPYQLPLGEDKVITIPCPDGINYIAIVSAQRVGNSPAILDAMIPNKADRDLVLSKMVGVPFPIVDILTGRVLRHYYGLPIEAEEKAGNSPSS